MTEGISRLVGRRISIVGASGSGKTHLAQRLADRLGLPHHELDGLRSDAGTSVADDADFTARVSTMLAEDGWIIDGHYRAVRSQIWQRADTVILLEYPLHQIAASLGRRYITNRRARSAAGANLPPAASARQAASWSQRLRRLGKTIRERREYGDVLRSPEFGHVKVITLTSRHHAKTLLDALPDAGSEAQAKASSSRKASPQIALAVCASPATRQRLLVEFVGFPGSGKSTVANGLIEQTGFVTRKQLASAWAELPLRKRLGVIFSLAGRPRLIWSVLRFLISNRSTKRDVLNRTARILAMTQWQLRHRQEIILDQGILQHLMSIHFETGRAAPAPDSLAPLIRSLYQGRDARVVFLQIDAERAAHRIAGRDTGFSRFDGLEMNHVSNLLQQSLELPQNIAKAAREAGLAVLEMDASRPVDEIIRAIGNWLSLADHEPAKKPPPEPTATT